MTFGYGSREFEVTADRLGCYRPEDHIDNPKGVSTKHLFCGSNRQPLTGE